MKINFRKIAAIGAGLLMTGMSFGVAAAANYPSPFVSGGVANTAIVYGAGAAASDVTASGSIQSNLATSLGGGTTSVSGGDSYKFEKESTKYHLGDNVTTVISSSLDDDELGDLLAEGKYVDDDNDEFDYTQKVDMGPNLQLSMFEDNDYVEDEPTLGFTIPSGTTILNYTLDFSDEPLIGDLATTDIPMMGKTYYVLSNTTSGASLVLTLLDSAEDTTLTEGSSATVAGHTVSISFISSTEVKLDIDGQTTNTLNEGETQKLPDGSYVGVKDILFNSKDTGVSSVEFSIGSGKLQLTSGSEIQINDEVVSGITAFLTNSTAALGTGTVTLDKVVIRWDADEDVFVTPSSAALMPGFEVIKFSYGGLTYPAEETIMVQQGGELYATLENFPLKDGEADIDFLYATTSGTFVGIGKDATNRLVTNGTGGTVNMTFDTDTDENFVVSWSDGDDAESYLFRAENFVLDGTNEKADFMYWKDGSYSGVGKKGAKNGDTFSIGNVELRVGEIDRTGHSVHILNNSVNTNFNTVYSKEGLKVYLPWEASNATLAPGSINFTFGQTGHGNTTFHLTMVEEDKDGNKAGGDTINATIGWDSSSTAEVQVSSYTSSNTDGTSAEIQDTDVWRDFAYSALATEILYNQPSSGQKSLELIYHGGEVTADVYATAPEASVTSEGGALGNVLVTDTEVSSVASKNLVVVGGSCINSAAASLLGGAYCESDFTDKTGIGAGQWMIKHYSSGIAGNSFALLVAGYEAADTVNAATYLTTNTVDTSAASLKGTSATSASTYVVPA